MKILLIQPQTSNNVILSNDMFILEPLALEYVAAALPENHEVKILDMRLENNLDEVLQSFNPDIVGLTAFIVHVNSVKSICRQVKEFRREIVTIIGGYQATICPQSFDEPYIDALVIGEGVLSFKAIVQCLENGQDYSSVKGIAYRQDGIMKFTEFGEYPPLDTLPLPRRDLTEHLRHNYFYEGIQPVASLITSKGCPFRCKFCTPWRQTGGKYMTRSPEAIVEELKQIKEPNIHVTDDESFADSKRMERLADLIKEAGINKKYYMYVRSDVVLRNSDLLRKWKEVGLTWVFIGFESNRQEDLLEYNKQNTVDTNERALAILREIGVEVFGSFIIKQDFDEKDFRDMAKYVRGLKLDSVYFTVLTPFPGTELYEEIKDKIITHNLEHYDFIHSVLPTKMPLRDFYSELALITLKVGTDIAVQNTPEKLQSYRSIYNKIKNAYKDYDGVDLE